MTRYVRVVCILDSWCARLVNLRTSSHHFASASVLQESESHDAKDVLHLLIFTIFTWCRRWWQWLLSCQCYGHWAHGPDSHGGCEVGMGLGASVVQASEDATTFHESGGESWKDMYCWLSNGEFPSHVCISNWDWTLPTSSICVSKAGRSISIVFGGEFPH